MGEIIERPVRGAAFHAEGEWAIPEGYEAEIKDGKIIVRKKESEDERMRKSLIEYLKTKDHECDHWIAYLEKQKERGPLTKEEEYTLQRIIEQLEDEGCPQSWKDLLYDIYNLPYEKQNEKKPAEWSEEDEKNLVSILWHVSYSVSNGKQTDCHCDLTDWLKALPERLKYARTQPQWKPSEAQKNALKEVLDMADAYGILQKMGATYDDIIELQNDLEEEF